MQDHQELKAWKDSKYLPHVRSYESFLSLVTYSAILSVAVLLGMWIFLT